MSYANILGRLVACLLVLLVSPFLALASAWVAFHAGLPVLYRAPRVGFQRRHFVMLKLRTMRARRFAEQWPNTTTDGDTRIIPGGAWLRRWKLDELPQLINIIRGEMAFVGPRPEMPIHLELYGIEHQGVFDVLPGLTDLASIRFFNLSAELARVAPATTDPDESYRSIVHSERMRLRLEYVRRKSVWLDLIIVARTIHRFVESVARRAD